MTPEIDDACLQNNKHYPCRPLCRKHWRFGVLKRNLHRLGGNAECVAVGSMNSVRFHPKPTNRSVPSFGLHRMAIITTATQLNSIGYALGQPKKHTRTAIEPERLSFLHQVHTRCPSSQSISHRELAACIEQYERRATPLSSIHRRPVDHNRCWISLSMSSVWVREVQLFSHRSCFCHLQAFGL
jgi:hypothetical protein